MPPLLTSDAEYFLATGRVRPPRSQTRLVAFLRRRGLDARLAAGENPLVDPLLGARAHHLTSARTRARVARGLDDLAERFAPPTTPARPSATQVLSPWEQAPAIAATRDALLTLSARLRSPEPVRDQGVALAAALVRDSRRELSHMFAPTLVYSPKAQFRWRAAARHATACLDEEPDDVI
jgi:hypothetical protein